jgi:hypothetical protein
MQMFGQCSDSALFSLKCLHPDATRTDIQRQSSERHARSYREWVGFLSQTIDHATSVAPHAPRTFYSHVAKQVFDQLVDLDLQLSDHIDVWKKRAMEESNSSCEPTKAVIDMIMAKNMPKHINITVHAQLEDIQVRHPTGTSTAAERVRC